MTSESYTLGMLTLIVIWKQLFLGSIVISMTVHLIQFVVIHGEVFNHKTVNEQGKYVRKLFYKNLLNSACLLQFTASHTITSIFNI